EVEPGAYTVTWFNLTEVIAQAASGPKSHPAGPRGDPNPRVTLRRVKAPSWMCPRLLDRYIVREIVPPTLLGLLVFSFILLINEIPRLLGTLVARGADLWTIIRVFYNLLPSVLAVTIPMAFLLGVLLAFGRMASES